MYQKTYSAAISGLSGSLLEIECFITGGLPGFNIIGISPTAANSCRERVRSALKMMGVSLPASRITVNIRSLDIRSPLLESVPWLDLPIALCILSCEHMIPSQPLTSALWLGELSLSGELKPLYGALTMARCAPSFIDDLHTIYLPDLNASEAALCQDMTVYGIESLFQAVQVIRKNESLTPALPLPQKEVILPSLFDRVNGQGIAKRVITLAAAGMHNLLMIGPPGCGKTMLSQTFPSLLPPLTYEEQLELTEIYSARAMLEDPTALISLRPFRSPHHSISTPALIGGGRIPMPGEVSLAHRGVLFLDELPELSRNALESLREPLESHQVKISRVHSTYSFPADFVMLSGMNPCPCGYYPDKTRCRCGEKRVRDYYGKVDSPLMDRMDLILRMESVRPDEIDQVRGLNFQEAHQMVLKAHEAQLNRFGTGSHFNSRMSADELDAYCPLSSADKTFITGAVEHFHLSMRAYHKLLRVARTIADVEGYEQIQRTHLLEALQYRMTELFQD